MTIGRGSQQDSSGVLACGVCIGRNGGWGCQSVEGDNDEVVVENGILLLLLRKRCTRGPQVPM